MTERRGNKTILFTATQLFSPVSKCLLLHTLMKILQNKFLHLQCVSATKIEAHYVSALPSKNKKLKVLPCFNNIYVNYPSRFIFLQSFLFDQTAVFILPV